MHKNKRRFLKGSILLLIILTMAFSSVIPLFAEGSISLYPKGTLPESATPYRPYTEWYGDTYAGMDRKQIIKVYAKAGETLFFGSSTDYSRVIDTTGTKDIKVTTPSGASSYYNVINGGVGHINSLAKEKAGPRYTDKGVVKNNNGYTPHQINVSQTGVYLFEFYSPYNTSNGNPSPVPTTSMCSPGTGGTVGIWDVTVVKNLGTSGGSGISETVRGRTFCNYLCMNMGANFFSNTADWGKGLFSTVYVLTDDGYIYKTDFNGMDPYGFLFFANNRGLINPISNTSLYHSARDTTNNMNNLKVTLQGKDGTTTITPVFHLPTAPNTALDKTYKIFFEMPANDLPESIRATPYMPGTVTDFKFFGESENRGYVGAGGLFSFNVTGGSSYQIKIDFAENYANTGRPANTLYLSNTCVPGYNSIYWDGRDGNGDIVPEGFYGKDDSEGSIKVTVQIKAGEYHFPLLDVESNPFGVKVELVNTPYNADGTLYKWPTPEAEREARTKIYYDNSLIISPGPIGDTTVVGNTTRGALWSQINGQLDALNGISSENGAAKFMATNLVGLGATILGGDFAFIDLWTYTVGDSTTLESSIDRFELIEMSDASSAQLKGLVYYDYDQATYSATTTYNVQKGDYPLQNVKVELYNSHGTLVATTYTDINGQYYVTGLPIGETYSVRVYSPYVNSAFTTHNTGITTNGNVKYLTFTQGPLSPALNTANNVGIHYDAYGKTLQVTKKWTKTLAEDPTRPGEITVSAVGSYNGIDYITVDATLNAFNGWNNVFYNLPAKNNNGNTLEYRIVETGAEGYISQTTTQVTEGGKITLYTLTNTPREMTIIKQLSEASTVDQQFIFKVEGNTDGISGSDITFNIVINVPAGETSATQVITHLPEGVYTVTELDTNWRYELVVSDTKGKINDTVAATPVNRGLTMTVSDASYYFIFMNKLFSSRWLDYNTFVSNKMKVLS